jgi:hypothetical protein
MRTRGGCRRSHFRMRGSCEACLPSPGGGGSTRAKRAAGWGDGLSASNSARVERSPHPVSHSLRSCEPTLPLQGRIRKRRQFREAIHSLLLRGAMDCFAALTMTWIWFRDLAARIAPELCLNSQALLKSEGAGKAGCRLAPAVSCAISARKTHTSIQVSAEASGLPCAMV